MKRPWVSPWESPWRKLEDPQFRRELEARLARVNRRSDGRFVSANEAKWRLRLVAGWLINRLEEEMEP